MLHRARTGFSRPAFALALAGAALLAGCGKAPPAPEPVRAIKVLTVASSGEGTALEFSGEVRAQVESRLGFRVGGKIVQRQAQLGERVKAGQVLAQLDAQDLKLAADAARAQVAAAQTQRDLAAADFKRYAALKDQNFISGAELERRDTTLKAAQAALEQAQAQLSAQGNQAAYASLLAPSGGIVTGIEAEPGQVVAAGTPVVRVAVDGARDAVFSVPEDKLAAMRVGAAVRVIPWQGGQAVEGKVREVAGSADPVTRTFLVKVGLPANAPLALGTTVTVTPAGATSQVGAAPVIKLPSSALRQEGQSTAVWVVDKASMTVKSQPVQVTRVDGNEAVIGAGLQPGQLVVAAGVHVLAAGEKVTFYKEPK